MLIRFFKASYPGQYLSLVILMVLFWIPSFLEPQDIAGFDQPVPLWDFFAALFSGSVMAALIFNIVIVFISSLLLNHVLTTFGIIPGNSLLGAFLYVLFTGVFIPLQAAGPLLLSNLLVLILIKVLLNLYDENEGYRTVFSAGFVISLLFLLFPPFIILIVPAYFVIILMGNVKWRELFIPLTGFALPVVYTLAFFYLADKPDFLMKDLWKNILDIKLIILHFDIGYWVLIILSIMLLLVAFFNMLGSIPGKNIDQRKSLTAIIHFLIFLFIIYLFSGFENRNITIILVPLVMVISWYLSEKRKILKFEILLWVIMATGFFRNFYLAFF